MRRSTPARQIIRVPAIYVIYRCQSPSTASIALSRATRLVCSRRAARYVKRNTPTTSPYGFKAGHILSDDRVCQAETSAGQLVIEPLVQCDLHCNLRVAGAVYQRYAIRDTLGGLVPGSLASCSTTLVSPLTKIDVHAIGGSGNVGAPGLTASPEFLSSTLPPRQVAIYAA